MDALPNYTYGEYGTDPPLLRMRLPHLQLLFPEQDIKTAGTALKRDIQAFAAALKHDIREPDAKTEAIKTALTHTA